MLSRHVLGVPPPFQTPPEVVMAESLGQLVLKLTSSPQGSL